MESGDPFIGTMFGGRWVVEKPLTSGGMGSVYVAKHAGVGRRVALKVIKSESAHNLEFVSRFKKETDALASVEHPRVVNFLDAGIENGNLYLVMELLSGRPLRDAMRRRVPWQEAIAICIDVCRGLAAVHRAGLIHRDLKPENVFLQKSEGLDEFAKLIDFGIVRLDDSSRAANTASATKTGAIVGTPGYISPEQLRGASASPASDIYAVGVMLYELVTGHFPFDAPNINAMLVKQLIDPLAPPRTYAPDLPAPVEEVILRFMQKEPADRVSSAGEAIVLLQDAEKRSAGSLPAGALTEAGDGLGQAVRLVENRPTSPTPMPTPMRLPHGPPQAQPVPVSALPSQLVRAATGKNRWLAPAAGGAAALVVAGIVGIMAFGADGADSADSAESAERSPAKTNAALVAANASPPSTDENAATGGRTTENVAAPASTPAVEEAGIGFLNITAKPDAKVTLDGKSIGTTPLLRVTASAGPHTVKLVSRGKEATKKVDLAGGATLDVAHDFAASAAAASKTMNATNATNATNAKGAAPATATTPGATTAIAPTETAKPRPTEEAIRALVSSHAKELLGCGGDRVPKRVTLLFSPSGNTSASVKDGDAPLACAKQQIAAWRVPAFFGDPFSASIPLVVGTKKPLPEEELGAAKKKKIAPDEP